MKAIDILKRYDSFSTANNWERIRRSNIINNADPTSFNYSMEEPILRRYGGFFNITSPWVFSAVQPCIRTGDFGRLKSDSQDFTHLTLFHIMPIPFRLEPNQAHFRKWHEDGIVKPLDFLTKELGLDLTRIRLSYFSGGSLRTISNGRIPSDSHIPEDKDTFDICLQYGMTSQQMLPQASPDTFLCVSPVAGSFYAGYRYEFFYQIPNGKFLEIGTGEALQWKQCIDNGEVIGIERMPGSVCVTALGLERCLLAANGSQAIAHCDHILPIVHEILRVHPGANERTAFLLVDALRAIHMIAADGGTYSGVNRHLREHLRALMKRVTTLSEEVGIRTESLRDLLELNASYQHWIPELASGVDSAIGEIQAYKERQ